MQSWRLFVRVMLARSYPRIICLRRLPGWIALETVLPVLAVSALAFVYRALHAPEEYLGYVVLGGAMTAFWLNVIWSMGAQLYWDREEGNLELFMVAPCSLMAILAGMALGGMAMTFVRAGAIVLAGKLFFGLVFAPTSWWALLGVFLLTLFALYGLGMVFASAFLWWGRQALHVIGLMQEPVYLLSGLNFPVRTLGTAVASGASLLPLTAGVDAMRQILFPRFASQGLMPVGVEAAILAGLGLIFIVVARILLRRIEKISRQEGRLTVRWL
ncbi:MAG TPA: ABC transporter permease [Gemmataceae bacterium]|nr:ABC transporter permease [Gemmataceae bacterium]